MPSKKIKVSSPKTANKKKPVKNSASNAKPSPKTAGKTISIKKPAKTKTQTPAKKKTPIKNITKSAVKATKKTISPKKSAKTTTKKVLKPSAKTKVIATKALTKKTPVKSPKVSSSSTIKTESVKKTTAKPVVESKKPESKSNHAMNGVVVKATEKKTPAQDKTKKPSDPFAKKNYADRSVSDVLAISNTIPVKQKNEISASKIASISNSITNPVKKTDSYAVRPEKEPSGKFELEFVIHASAEMLYEFLSTPSGLSEWFCDDLNIRNGIYTFIWDDQLQQARLLKTVDVQLVRFQWVDKTDGSYFEFRIQRDDLTNDISLIITDFADSVADRESSKLLWHSQIEKLMHVIGSIF